MLAETDLVKSSIDTVASVSKCFVIRTNVVGLDEAEVSSVAPIHFPFSMKVVNLFLQDQQIMMTMMMANFRFIAKCSAGGMSEKNKRNWLDDERSWKSRRELVGKIMKKKRLTKPPSMPWLKWGVVI